MRKSLIFAIVAVALATGLGYAQEMPPEVKAFLDNYTTDSTAPRGPLYAKSRGYFDDSTPIKDLRWRAIQTYQIKKNISLDKYPDTVALSEIIEPIQHWYVLIMAHGKPLYVLGVTNKEGQPKFITDWLPPSKPGAEFKNSMWVPLLKAYPASTGINPMVIQVIPAMYELNRPLPKGYGGFVVDHFFYFKQKGPRKIYYIGSSSTERTDLLRKTVFTASLEALDDSRKLVKYLKDIINMSRKNYEYSGVDERAKLEKSNDMSKRDSSGWRGFSPMKIKGDDEMAKERRRMLEERAGGK